MTSNYTMQDKYDLWAEFLEPKWSLIGLLQTRLTLYQNRRSLKNFFLFFFLRFLFEYNFVIVKRFSMLMLSSNLLSLRVLTQGLKINFDHNCQPFAHHAWAHLASNLPLVKLLCVFGVSQKRYFSVKKLAAIRSIVFSLTDGLGWTYIFNWNLKCLRRTFYYGLLLIVWRVFVSFTRLIFSRC